MSNFKIILTSIFAVCLVGAILIFALSKSSTVGNANLLVWGTLKPDAFDALYKNSSIASNKQVVVRYIEKDPTTFDTDFVEALADGHGPDIVLLREDLVYKNRNRLFPIPYKNYSERTFKSTFIQEGEMFLTPDGVLSFPLVVDPLVMYWNRDLFSNNLVSLPPKYWDEVYTLLSKFTKRDKASSILQSTIALGEWNNVLHAKEILSMLFMQAGTPITLRGTQGEVRDVLNESFDYPVQPSQAGLNFYTQFSNPTSPYYSWNRSLPNSLNFFLSGNLATYIGFASEIFSIQQKNPNLNFDVVSVPQAKGTQKKIVFAHMYGLSIVKQSQQVSSAFLAVSALTEPTAIQALETVVNLPPSRRDLLANKPTDAFRSVFYDSALISSAWIDPDTQATSNIFREMIESVTSGRARVTEALTNAGTALNNLFN